MSNLLVITDVARLRKIFGRLTEDKNIRLRVVNNLEKGGEEITIEKPDVVFVQTHLSGLSADILLMHLKKQLGRRRTRFVLLTTADKINDSILKSYQGWLDTSAEDGQFLSELQQLLGTLLSKPRKTDATIPREPAAATVAQQQPVSPEESSALLGSGIEAEAEPAPQQTGTELQHHVPSGAVPEPSLEEQGITYSPRQRLKVFSEFSSSFDSAVSSTRDAEPLDTATPAQSFDWDDITIETAQTKPARSKKRNFLIWLVPVIFVVVIITFLQQRRQSVTSVSAPAKAVPDSAAKPVVQAPVPLAQPPAAAPPAKQPIAAAPPVAPQVPHSEQGRVIDDKAVLSAIAEGRNGKTPAASTPAKGRLTTLPDFIPRYGFDKQFSTTNPGWERYKGQVTEFKVLREAQAIKAIQVIDRGGRGVPESFMKGVLRQVAKNPSFAVDASEKKDGYEIQRGRVSENVRAVYYRDIDGGQLRAFVITWQ